MLTEELLLRQPYGRNDPVLNGRMIKNILLAAVYQLIVLFVILFAPTGWLLDTVVASDGTNIIEQCQQHYGKSDAYYYTGCVKKTHFTIAFNAFVYMILFNQVNSRKVSPTMTR